MSHCHSHGSSEHEQKLVFEVKGMTCNHCVMSVTKAVEAVHGVKRVNVDLATGKVTVTVSSSNASKDAIAQAIKDAGYEVVA